MSTAAPVAIGGGTDQQGAEKTGDTSKMKATNGDLRPKSSLLQKLTYDVDYIGNGSFQVSQLNLLQKRSIEPLKETGAKLSARGLHHRSREIFVKEVVNASTIIDTALRNDKKLGGKNKPAESLFGTYFQRALGNERMNLIDKAITDYNTCLAIDNKSAICYFNRSGLYKLKGDLDKALADLLKAVELEPGNMSFRTNLSLLYRQRGQFLGAIQETMICRAVEMQPHLQGELALGNELHLDSDQLLRGKLPDDPILVALAIPQEKRTDESVDPAVDFLRGLKFFAGLSSDTEMLRKIAKKLEVQHYAKGDYIFSEGQEGHHFFMILDGEVSIVRVAMNSEGEVLRMITLVKLFRGQAFGETALDGKGKRTAGALATQNATLVTLHAKDYQEIMSKYKLLLRSEVRLVLSTVPMFKDWEPAKLDILAASAVCKSFTSSFEIVKEGDPVQHLYIVKRGIISLIKSMEKPQVAQFNLADLSNPETAAKVEAPGLWVLDKNWRDRMTFDKAKASEGTQQQICEFTVGVLGSGQVFGELAILDPELLSPVSAISFTAVEVYCFDSETLLSLGARFVSTCINSLNESMNLHNPPAEKTYYYFRANYGWEGRKLKLMENITRENPKLLPLLDAKRQPPQSAAHELEELLGKKRYY